MSLKTSRNLPLSIAEIAFGPDEGRLGLTLCPGKKDPSRRWDRNLADDLRVVRAWGAETVVTLLENQEFGTLDVSTLGREVQRHGMDWIHLPIRDVDVPDSAFESAWELAGRVLHERIDAGQRILVHCRGGIGRTGMVAGRLLVERGCDSRVAVNRVRGARPGAIETEAQERHVLRCSSRVSAIDTWSSRVLGSLLAGAIGDAAGYLVEFDRIDAIRRQHGHEGLRLHQVFLSPLHVSDDTQMTLFTLEGLFAAIATGDDSPAAVEAAIREAYLDWFGTQLTNPRAPIGNLARDQRLQQIRAPGGTCMSAMAAGGSTWSSLPQRPINNSKGCGTVMRTAPIGWFRRWSPERAFEIGMRASAITHAHPTGYIAGGAMSAMVRGLMDGDTLEMAARRAMAMASAVEGGEETVAAIGATLELAASTANPVPETIATLGEGWVAEEALAIGLYAALVGDNMARTLEIAINHSGDSDSTASIAGQLRGAAEGMRGIPYDLLRRIDVLDPIRSLLKGKDWA